MGDTKLHKLREKAKEELEGMYKEGPLEAAKITTMKDLAKLVYYLDEICGDDDEGYSMMGTSGRGRSRDAMGRFSGSRYPGSFNGMSYDEARDVMTHRLGDLMMCTNDQFTQSVLSDALQRIQNH